MYLYQFVYLHVGFMKAYLKAGQKTNSDLNIFMRSGSLINFQLNRLRCQCREVKSRMK